MLGKTFTITAVAAALLSAAAVASPGEYDRDDYYERRGPMPFELLDRNDDGKVTADEYAQARAERHRFRVDHGYRMQGMQSAPNFDRMDRDGSGAIDRDELSQWQAQRMQQRHARRLAPVSE